MTSAWSQLYQLTRIGIQSEFAEKERLASPLLFAATVLLLFNFVLGDIDPVLKVEIFVAETFLTMLMALQISVSRLFEPESQDRAFDVLRTYPIAPTAWFVAKCLQVLFTGILVVIPTILIAGFFHQDPRIPLVRFEIIGIALAALIGLTPIGVLLSALTMKAGARQILYPLIFFPLTVPVLLASVHATLRIYLPTAAVDDTQAASWLVLLTCFDVVYVTLGFLLFGELIDDT